MASYVILSSKMNKFWEIYKACKKLTDKLEEAAGKDKEKQKKAIAQQIKIYRLGNKLTQDELARKLGVTKMEIIRWEGEQYMPSKLALERLKELGVIKGS